MKRFIIYPALCALSVHARTYRIFTPGPGDAPEAQEYAERMGRTPNFTDTARFERTYNGSQEQWGLRINLTDLPVLGLPYGPLDNRTRVPNTQYELQWPGEADTFQDFLRERNVSVRITARIMNVRYNISSRYDPNDTSCASVLGERCSELIRKNAASAVWYPSVPSPGQPLEGCEVDGSVIARNMADAYYHIDANSTWNGYDNATLDRGDTLLHYAGDAFNASDMAVFTRAKGALHLVTMSFNYTSSRFKQGDDSGPTLLCRIIEKPTEDLFVEEEGAAAAVWRQSTAGLLSVALMGAVATVW